MAEFVGWRGLAAAGVLAGAFAYLPAASAQPLDPTRPPASLAEPGGEDGKDEDAAPVVQSILISPKRKVAVIGGRTVGIGDKVGHATVVRITEEAVVLRSGNTRETIKVFPDIQKQRVAGNAVPGSGTAK